MTRLIQFANNAVSRLAANIANSATSLALTPGDGSKFPSISGSQFFMATLVKTDGTTEVVKVTARATDTLTIVRAAESVGGVVTAYAFTAGDKVEARLTSVGLSGELDRLDAAALLGAANKSANYTVVAADISTLLRTNTASGTITITLPLISTLTDDFDTIIAKVSSDANTISVASSSPDTINGAAIYTLYTQFQSVWLIADRSTNTWTAVTAANSGANVVVDAFTGAGTAGPFTLSGDPVSKNNTIVVVGGTPQLKSSYTLSGTALTLGGVVATGVLVEVWWTQPLVIGVPSDGSVNTVKLADGSVNTVKLADGSVNTVKLADGSVSTAKIIDGNVTAAKLDPGAAVANIGFTPANAALNFGFKNRIINGDMRIDQRNAGASITANNDVFLVDRFQMVATQTSKLTAQRNAGAVAPPAGFTNYLGFTSSSAYALTSGDIFAFRERIEGFNVADLSWGTVNASPITVSFLVRSSLTGTFGGAFENAASNRCYPFSYTISAANTWETKTVTIAGDTSGTWLTDNGAGLQFALGLGVGSTGSGTAGAWGATRYWSATGATSVVGTSGATFYITGVQLEKGSTATAYDFRDYGRELIMCQRYYVNAPISTGIYPATGTYMGIQFPTSMRTNPTVSATTGSGGVGANITSTTYGFISNTSSATPTGVGYIASAEL